MLIQFYLNGRKFVKFHDDMPLPPGSYLCLECADEKTLFNGADMKQTRRRGVIVNDGCPYFPPENWLFVQQHPRTVFLRTSHEDVVTALSVGTFRTSVEESIWRAIGESGTLEFSAARPGFFEVVEMCSDASNAEQERLGVALIRDGETDDEETMWFEDT